MKYLQNGEVKAKLLNTLRHKLYDYVVYEFFDETFLEICEDVFQLHLKDELYWDDEGKDKLVCVPNKL
jgi:hypothetical protein